MLVRAVPNSACSASGSSWAASTTTAVSAPDSSPARTAASVAAHAVTRSDVPNVPRAWRILVPPVRARKSTAEVSPAWRHSLVASTRCANRVIGALGQVHDRHQRRVGALDLSGGDQIIRFQHLTQSGEMVTDGAQSGDNLIGINEVICRGPRPSLCRTCVRVYQRRRRLHPDHTETSEKTQKSL